jgi:hypothetical protein
MKKSLLILLALLLFFESGCAHVARFKTPPPPQKPPRNLTDYYRYSPLTSAPHVTLLKSHKTYTEKKMVFQGVEDTTGYRSPLVIDYYEPNEKKRHPLIVITPILGKNYGIERSFANYFANRGFACAIVHRRRLRLLPDEEVGQIEAYFRSSIVRLRMAIDWLKRQEKVDPEAIGAFGISFGGILNTVLAGIEPQIKSHLIALAGGDLPSVLCYSHEKTIQRYRNQFMKRKGLTLDEFRDELKASIVSEPMVFAHFVDTHRVYLFIALFDLVIGKKHALKLAKAFGQPESYYVPLGHYSSMLVIPFIRIKAVKFFEAQLKQNS